MTSPPQPLDLDAYRRDGFLVCRWPLFPAEMIDAVDAIGSEYVRQAQEGKRAADLNVPHFDDPRLFEFLMDPRVIDLVDPIVGPDIALWTSQFFCKSAGVGRPYGWHADASYWEGFVEPIRVASLWMALDDVDRTNGCLRVVRGSHLRRDYRYLPRRAEDDAFFPRVVDPAQIDPGKVVDIEIRRGEFVLFDAYLVHGSGPNPSERRRMAFTLRYMPTTCRVHPFGRRGVSALARRILQPIAGALRGRPLYEHRIYLARGEDRAGNRYCDWRGPNGT